MTRTGSIAIGTLILTLAAAGGYATRGRWLTRAAPSPPSSAESMRVDPPGTRDVRTPPRGDVTLDLRRQQLIGVRTIAVSRAVLQEQIRALGTVRYDERRLTDVNVKIEGWIRDLYVDYTGQPISAGQPLFTLYSPELLTTENEYLLALAGRDRLQQSPVTDARDSADRLVASARQRLALWDVSADDIRAMDERRVPRDVVTFRSPAGGFVIEKQALKGLHVVPGQSLYKIADLSVVWVEADVYERDLSVIRVGQAATVTLDAYPNERRRGRVVYIYPTVDEKSRTTKVRYEFPNRTGRLKPGMFASVEIEAGTASGLAVPVDAVLDSGADQLVFVAQGDGHFAPTRVKVGRRLGQDVEILEGLSEGEEVASAATFFLDSESQLRAAAHGYDAPPGVPPGVAPGVATSSPGERMSIAMRTQPDPLKVGDNDFEVTVKDSAGKPIDDAQVGVQLFMAAMPTMNMPAVRSEVKLSSAGSGVYRGRGEVMTSGRWDVTVSVTRRGQRLASQQLTAMAK